MGRKCGVEGCLSDSNRSEDTGVTFHKVPVHSDIRPKWFSLCRISEDKKNVKMIYICSRHFLRVDFCNFKGKKYMLRQGVLPSVFPWDKSKLDAIKTNAKPEEKCEVKDDVKQDLPEVKSEENNVVEPEVKEESVQEDVDVEPKVEEEQDKITYTSGLINFAIDCRIDVLDNNNEWSSGRIVEIDYEENEVLIRVEKSPNKCEEWICMDSPRIRPFQVNRTPPKKVEKFVVGERCLATWSDARKFPATITKITSEDTYEVLFDDGFVKILKVNKLSKTERSRPKQASPLFDPIQSSKEERREKKRKINVAALFGKKSRLDTSDSKPNSSDDYDRWLPQWENGLPVGIESTLETSDGPRKSYIVNDPRLPEGWVKHLIQRIHGMSAGKWEVLILSPDGRRFRSRSELFAYLREMDLKHNHALFDFTIYKSKPRVKKEMEFDASPTPEVTEPEAPPEEEDKNLLKIPIVNNSYECPIEGCGKRYRKENLAQMHVKHYHPEYTKFLDSTPNVADLAYARTVGESLDRSPSHYKSPVVKPATKSSTPKSVTKPQVPEDSKCEPSQLKNKDSEIIKLLSTKPAEESTETGMKPLPSGLPSNMYPDIKLKDLLTSDGIPNRDNLSLRALSTTRPGIKTLLPVRPEMKRPEYELKAKTNIRRKRGLIDSVDSPTGNDQLENTLIPPETPSLVPPPNNIIIEGGQVIKIVRMKQEEIINCTCGFTEEDGLMIQCDLCLCWQHAFCNNIERESQVPEKYVCWICQNPSKQRMSKKYFHDQDWLKHGVLATTSFHTKDEDLLSRRFTKLKKSHDISGGIVELAQYVHTLKIKLKIAETKNHPKLYLWSKPWEKQPAPEVTLKEELKPKPEELEPPIKPEAESMLMMFLKNKQEDIKTETGAIKAPEPEAAIDSADCQINLLEHIKHCQNLVEDRLDDFENQIASLEENMLIEEDEDHPRTRQTLNMLLRDLGTLQELSQLTTL